MCNTASKASSAGIGNPRVTQSRIPRLNNPANIPSNHMTEDEFLMLRGVGSSTSGIGIDTYAGANRLYMSDKQVEKTRKNISKANDEYYSARNKAKAEYQQLVSQGKIVPKTGIEKIVTAAHGNPDLQATQAARRMAEKKGINWRTGKKLKNSR